LFPLRERAGRFAGQPVIVTGARGFIGTHLVDHLVAAGAEVHALSRRRWNTAEQGCHTWSVDLRDADAARQIVRDVRPAAIFHLASLVIGHRDVALVQPALADNLITTVNLMTAAAEYGNPRVVLAGSMEEPHPGEKTTTPSSPYAASKWAATAYAQMFHALWELPTVVLRIAMAYGPRQRDHHKLVPHVITSLLAGRSPMLTSGEREIDWIFVDDVVDAFLTAATEPAAAGTIIDIGSGAPTAIRTTVELIHAIIGSDVPLRFGALEDRRLDSARIAVTADASELLGWSARVGLHEGLVHTIDWYRQQHDRLHTADEPGPFAQRQASLLS
jgi:nucleoside-diphosphate-sugar epimerase